MITRSSGGASSAAGANVVVVPALSRFATDTDWLTSRHSFSFGHHYDAANTHFGQLLVSNDDVVAPGTGFDTHPHRDMEIVTWVLSGSLVHQDSEGNNGIIYPGLAQRMSAGRGILHSEKNDSWRIDGREHTQPVHFVQMWVAPDERGIAPGYQQLDISDELATGEFVVVASGLRKHRNVRAIGISQRDAGLSAARLPAHQRAALPAAPLVHVFVGSGWIRLESGQTLSAGDSARITDAASLGIAAGPEGAEVLVWEMHSSLGSGR